MMTKDFYITKRYDAELESRKSESTVAYGKRRTSTTMDSGRSGSFFSRQPVHHNSRSRSPMSVVENNELSASTPQKSTEPKSLLRAADLLKIRSFALVKSRPPPEQPEQSRLQKMVSNRLIPLTEVRRQQSVLPNPPPPRDPVILPESRRDVRPARSLHKSLPASGRGPSTAPRRKRSFSTLRECNVPNNPEYPMSNRCSDSTSPVVGQRTSEASGQGFRLHFDVSTPAECKLLKEIQGLREKLQAIENNKRIQESKMHHLLSEQWKTVEMLVKEKSAIINQIKVTKSQCLGPQGEERLIELLEKQEQYERDIEEAEGHLQEINDKVANARREQNLKLKEEMRTLKNMENTLIHQRKWSFLQKAIKQAMNKYYKISRASNDHAGQILNMFQLKKEFHEKYDSINRQMKSRRTKILQKRKISSVGDTGKKHRAEVDFSETETLVGLDKLTEDIAELQKLVYSNNFLFEAQNDGTRIKSLIPKDPVSYPVPLHIKDKHDRMKLCDTVLNKFVRSTNTNDPNKICKVYKQLEKNNFELLQSVHDLNIRNHEMNSEDEDQALQVALWRHKNGVETLNLLQRKIKLQSKFETLSAECEQLECTCDKETETILAVMQRIDKILRLTGCYSLAKCNEFGAHHPLGYENVAKYLAVLKERVRNILQLYSYHVKNASSLQKNKESQNIFTNEGTAISSSSPQLKTHRLLTEKESAIVCPGQLSDTTKTSVVKRRKTLAEMQAEIDAVRKRNSVKTGIFPQMSRENADLFIPKGDC